MINYSMEAAIDEVLYELVNTSSHYTMTPEQKKLMLANNLAVGIARHEDDPLYDKYSNFKLHAKELKSMIIHKYGNKGLQAANNILHGKKSV